MNGPEGKEGVSHADVHGGTFPTEPVTHNISTEGRQLPGLLRTGRRPGGQSRGGKRDSDRSTERSLKVAHMGLCGPV